MSQENEHTTKDNEKQEEQAEPKGSSDARDIPIEESAEAVEAEEQPEANGAAESKEAEAVEEPPETESERYIRLAAEFDNYKKRTAREFGDLIKTANARLLRNLVEIADNFERALTSGGEDDNSESYRKGVELIYGQLEELLKRENVTPIESVGQPFDPNLHEAMMQQPSDEFEEGIVVQEIQKGYQLSDKVLRHARVIVSAGAAREDDEEHKDA
jgi:molecular chaperone GrpE